MSHSDNDLTMSECTALQKVYDKELKEHGENCV